MKTIIVTALILFSAICRYGAAINVEEETEVASSVPTVNLGLFMLFDQEAKRRWKNPGVFDVNDYLNTMVEAAEHIHFGNVTCADINLVFLGSHEINESSGIEEKKQGDIFLKVKPTLSNLKEYFSANRETLGRPDMMILVTGLHFETEAKGCGMSESTDNPMPGAYCYSSRGATYFKSICEIESVAIIRDDSPDMYGVSALAQQIARQMGVRPDNHRNEKDCPKTNMYFTRDDWRNSNQFQHAGLSGCAEGDLLSYIDSMRNRSDFCWNDVPNATYPEVDLQTKDICKYRNPGSFKCNKTMDYEKRCYLHCCVKSSTCPEGKEYEPTCQTYKAQSFHNGKYCEDKGICFEGKCRH